MPLTAGLLATNLKSRALLHWRARDLSLTALTGQVATFVRASTAAATSFDGGAAINMGYGQPAWDAVDLDLNGTRESAGLLLGNTGEALSWNIGGNLDTGRSLTIYGVAILRDVTQVSARLVQFGKGDNTNPRLLLYLSGSGQLSFRHDNSVSSVQTTSVAVANGNILEFRCCFNANGSVFLGYAIGANPGSGTETVTATTATLTPGGWSGNTLWAGSINGANECPMDLVTLKMVSGVQAMQTMRDLF